MDSNTLKVCRKCGCEKQIAMFYKNHANRDGVGSYCKSCSNNIAQAFAGAHREIGRKKAKRQFDKVGTSYVAHLIGLPVSEVSPELVEIKREQILIKRAIRELNKTLKELNGN